MRETRTLHSTDGISFASPHYRLAGRSGKTYESQGCKDTPRFLIRKIVLIVELPGRPHGVGFEIGTAFQLFDLRRILAYAGTFVVLMLIIEALVPKPLEQRASRWRKRST